MLFKIPFLSWTGKAALEIEIPDGTKERFRFRAALEIAVNTRADLTGADLTRADLSGADLTRADLTGVDLTRADLTRADLTGVDLTGADLTRADLTRADLTGVVLTGADLTGVDLTGADLTGADLTGAVLRATRADLFDVLIRAIPEVPGLLQALRNGKIDGSSYSGDCACLVGTIANVRHADVYSDEFKELIPTDSSRPAERWFLGIKKGDTPETNPIAKITEDWILEFMSFTGIKEAA